MSAATVLLAARGHIASLSQQVRDGRVRGCRIGFQSQMLEPNIGCQREPAPIKLCLKRKTSGPAMSSPSERPRRRAHKRATCSNVTNVQGSKTRANDPDAIGSRRAKEFSFIPRLTFQGERLRPAAQSVRVYGRGAGRSPLHRKVKPPALSSPETRVQFVR